MKTKGWFGVLGLLMTVAIVGAACSGSGGEGSAKGVSGGATGGMGTQAQLTANSPETLDMQSSQREIGAPADEKLPALQPKVIKTADVSLGVSDNHFSRAFSEARNVADRFGGYNLESSVSGSGRDVASLRLRVPSRSFTAALNDLEDLSGMGKVRSERISGQDVTNEFVDLKARLQNLSSQRRVLLRLMDRTHTIADSIRVEDQLRSVQLQIEQIKGQLRYLDNETSYSTISATISAGVPVASDPTILERAWDGMTAVTTAIVSAVVIGGAAIVPIAVLLLVAFIAFRLVRPRISSIKQA